MGNVNYDSTLDFGNLDLTGADTEFPNILNLGKTSADRMKVDILVSADAAGGTALTVTVQGSADGTSNWTDVGTNTITLDDLLSGKGAVVISPNSFQYLQIGIAKAGTFTGGTAGAQLNTYVGK
jgi:hypothetical protein